jgi:hypothetical protein
MYYNSLLQCHVCMLQDLWLWLLTNMHGVYLATATATGSMAPNKMHGVCLAIIYYPA